MQYVAKMILDSINKDRVPTQILTKRELRHLEQPLIEKSLQ